MFGRKTKQKIVDLEKLVQQKNAIIESLNQQLIERVTNIQKQLDYANSEIGRLRSQVSHRDSLGRFCKK